MKQNEISRFVETVADQSEDEYSKQVTDWEQREYFELF
ncbi:glutamine synthetase catalytic region [Calothrix sp. NIES-4071]|nr:glutamine synthetase catalytic region [Calothrix sp. NIES-4071]BAZ64233.1 glutamine synthetase catalytic region [Calothrix sp. NIES-4105]